MAYIGTPPSNAFTSLLKQDFSTSATTGYTLDHAVNNANDIALFINFVRQEPTAGYAASGTTLTLTSATASSDDMYCVYLGQALQTVNPPNASVGLSQLTATGTKDATTFLRGDNTFAEAGGGLVQLSSTTVSGSSVSSIDFTSSIITSTYDTYYFTIMMSPETDNASLWVRFSDGGSFNSGSSDYGYVRINDSGFTATNGNSALQINDASDSSIANAWQGELTLLNPQNSSVKTVINYHGQRNDGDPALNLGGGQRLTAEANDGIRFLFSSGNVSVGSRVTCYGIVK